MTQARNWLLGAITALLLACAVPAAAQEPRSAIPLGNPGEWITSQDYPPAALRDNKAGTVGFTVNVDEQGKIEACSVSRSSGAPALDDATCALVMQRARFSPAIDAQGRPAKGVYSNRVRWTVPEVPPAQVVTNDAVFIIESDGRISNCQESTKDGRGQAVPITSGYCTGGRSVSPPVDATGKSIRVLMHTQTTTSFELLP